MKKQSIWVFQWRKSVHYWWSYILFSPECKELTSMLDPLLYRWGVPPVVIRCVHWTMQMWVLQTWIKALGLYIVMGRDSVSNHQPHDCLFNRFFRRRLKETSKLRVTGLCAGNSPGTGEFPAQMASNVENVSIWWRYHVEKWLSLMNVFTDGKHEQYHRFLIFSGYQNGLDI